jgi:hypothetical protein
MNNGQEPQQPGALSTTIVQSDDNKVQQPDPVVQNLLQQLAHATRTSPNPQPTGLLTERIRKYKIDNDRKEDDQSLKRKTLNRLFIFLACETFLIFTMIFFQGFKICGFDIDHISFRIVVSATITQIAGMLFIAVRHLFPSHKVN